MSAVATQHEIHPLAHLMPEMREAEYAELREDIAANGLHEALTLYEGKVLDGRHRYRACAELGVWPHFTTYDGDAPAAFVLSLNVKRRQLTQSQKAMLATDFKEPLAIEAKLRQGTRTDLSTSEPTGSEVFGRQNFGRSAEQAARIVGVGHGSVIRANKVKEEDPELADRVRSGEVTVLAAYKQVQEGRPSTAVRDLTSDRDRMRNASHAKRFTELVSKLDGYAEGITSLDQDRIRAAMEPAELDEWTSSLGKSLTALSRFRRTLKEGTV